MPVLPPSEILMLLFGVLMGEYQLDPLLLFEGPQSRWALPRSPITWKTSFSLLGQLRKSESDIAADQHYPQVLPAGTRLLPGNTARRARHRQEPGTLSAEVLLPRVSRTCLEVGRSQPSGKCRASLRSLSRSLLSHWCSSAVFCLLSVFLLAHL